MAVKRIARALVRRTAGWLDQHPRLRHAAVAWARRLGLYDRAAALARRATAAGGESTPRALSPPELERLLARQAPAVREAFRELEAAIDGTGH